MGVRKNKRYTTVANFYANCCRARYASRIPKKGSSKKSPKIVRNKT